MIDIKIIRENPELIRKTLQNRNDNAPIDEIIKLDESYRRSLQETESLRAKRNDVSKQISKMKEKPAELIAEMRQVGEKNQCPGKTNRQIWLPSCTNTCSGCRIFPEMMSRLARMPMIISMFAPGVSRGSLLFNPCRTGSLGKNSISSIFKEESNSRAPVFTS